ncbi:hypothetical protein A2215_03765 [Candidatus Berkelbacteria bacterium RIFOXYA2_FULL_43_10]|uniref:Peptidase C39 domain-containing protein n=1 Tax=Candidatus Berkelbacteria bacterium RIFOXYA2_FULL_43_10 TaxID=1797472 RepID=A0A1F5E4J8_9BACT|nr:MAG: hypothetical protein A2215_03765 [Candidatus Berkelbacteria bacterium RIFOXYA2_FULL_43_10]
MKPVVQKHPFGCAIACVAHVLGIRYDNALTLFRNGSRKAKNEGFYCRDIIKTLGNSYYYFYVKDRKRKLIYREGTIVYIRKSKKHPAGHYLAKTPDGWMDPWINFPENKDIRDAKAGIRKRLPGKAMYTITPK